MVLKFEYDNKICFTNICKCSGKHALDKFTRIFVLRVNKNQLIIFKTLISWQSLNYKIINKVLI